MQLEIILDAPHENQLKILREQKRFNVVNCGRRFGKTVLAKDILLEDNGIIDGYPVAYFAPTYKMLGEVWKSLIETTYPIISYKSETDKRIEFVTGGHIDFWSLEDPNSIRGRKYKKAVIDEAAVVKNLKEAWTKVIRPTLTDLKGQGWFFSTPKGKSNYFYDLFQNENKFETWKSWSMPTIANPHIDPQEIEDARRELDPISFAQEYLASFVTEEFNRWAYSYNRDKHVGKTELNKAYEVFLSFDFNRDPITCYVGQHYNGWIYGIEQIKLKSSNIYDLCDHIWAKYGGLMLIVTGDATGKASSALVKDNLNYYTVIKSKLKLGQAQLRVGTVNPPIEENRVLVNSILHNRNVVFDEHNCKQLIFDLEHASVLPDGSLDKSDRKDPTKQLDALDCFRYYLNTFHKHVLKF